MKRVALLEKKEKNISDSEKMTVRKSVKLLIKLE